VKYKDEEYLYEQHWEKMNSLRQIGRENDVSHKTISYWFEKLDVRKRSQGGEFPWVPFRTVGESSHSAGYERWVHTDTTGEDRVKQIVSVHRLLAVSEHGLNGVEGKSVHHKNGIKWDNRPENIELMEPGEHTAHHHEEGDYDGNEFWKYSENYQKSSEMAP
jgi:hypothetical protein